MRWNKGDRFIGIFRVRYKLNPNRQSEDNLSQKVLNENFLNSNWQRTVQI